MRRLSSRSSEAMGLDLEREADLALEIENLPHKREHSPGAFRESSRKVWALVHRIRVAR